MMASSLLKASLPSSPLRLTPRKGTSIPLRLNSRCRASIRCPRPGALCRSPLIVRVVRSTPQLGEPSKPRMALTSISRSPPPSMRASILSQAWMAISRHFPLNSGVSYSSLDRGGLGLPYRLNSGHSIWIAPIPCLMRRLTTSETIPPSRLAPPSPHCALVVWFRTQ